MNFKKSIVVAIVYGVGGMLLGGFFQQHVPSWLAWLQYGTYMLYSYDAALSIEFSNSPTFRWDYCCLKTVCVLYLFTHCWFTNSPLKTTCLAGKAYIVEAYFLKRPSALNKSNFSLFEWNEISEKCFFSDNGGGLRINNVTCGAGSFSVASAVTDFPAHRKI